MIVCCFLVRLILLTCTLLSGSAVVTNVQVTDDNLPVSISITSGDTNNQFSFTGITLNVVGDVDRETTNSFILLVSHNVLA